MMLIANCLIADDEPIAREIIEKYCVHLPALKVVASCSNAMEARAVMQKEKIDILFLDINMPVLDGISFLKTIQHKPQVIFTTAYKEYAINAFDLAAVDYLLKPFSLDRFIVAVDKAMERLEKPVVIENQSSITEKTGDFIFIKTESKIFRVAHKDIIYAEASGNYSKIITTQQTLMPSITFSSFEELLPAASFIRIHRSFIVNKLRITHIEGNRVFINSIEIPIGSNYKDRFLKELGL